TLLPLPAAFAAIGPLFALAAILAALSGRPIRVTLPTPVPLPTPLPATPLPVAASIPRIETGATQ
ncbi:MAG TPA: hypothetical protein VK887_04190, partial [Pseudonocardiaceae bacterium]|nr:hypothetical protein [Pseudonocardiaceae bacterium]